MKLATVTLASLWLSCAPSTQITFDIHTDVPCDEVGGVAVSVGAPGTVEDLGPELVTKSCSAEGNVNAIGTWAVVPTSGAVEASVRVVLAAVGVNLKTDCTSQKDYAGCIVARRTVGFLPHRGLVVPVDLLLVCRGVACDQNTTCNRLGRCVAARVDTTQCTGDVCATTVTPPGPQPSDTDPVPGRTTLIATPATVVADGVSIATLTLTVHDANDQPVAGQPVLLTISGADNWWDAQADATDDAGVFVARLASARAETKTVRATVAGFSVGATVSFVASDGGFDAGQPVHDAQNVSSAYHNNCLVFGANRAVSCDSVESIWRTVPGLVSVLDVSVGDTMNCAVLSPQGNVKCWGRFRDAGVLDVQGVSDAIALSSPGNLGCAVLADGGGACWGGNPDAPSFMKSTALALRGPASSVSVGRIDSCFVLADQTVQCLHAYADAASRSLAGVIRVSASGWDDTLCALLTTGAVYCMGTNRFGELGDGTTASRNNPGMVTGLNTAVDISAGQEYTCAVLASGRVVCWGEGGFIGDGTNTRRLIPTEVSGITNAVRVSAGSGTSCALLATGGVRCWGSRYGLTPRDVRF